jgi:hypothetical protein
MPPPFAFWGALLFFSGCSGNATPLPPHTSVIPAQAGSQRALVVLGATRVYLRQCQALDSRLRGNDEQEEEEEGAKPEHTVRHPGPDPESRCSSHY